MIYVYALKNTIKTYIYLYIRELAERFKATSLKLVKTNNFHGFKSYTLWMVSYKFILSIAKHNYTSLMLLYLMCFTFYNYPCGIKPCYNVGAPSLNYIINYGLEPGWLGASFGLRTCYVRIIIIRYNYIGKHSI